MSEQQIPAPRRLVPTYVATPSTGGPWPGVVLVHDFTGMSHDLRGQADWLAGAGFLAAAPDLFHWGDRLKCLRPPPIAAQMTLGSGTGGSPSTPRPGPTRHAGAVGVTQHQNHCAEVSARA